LASLRFVAMPWLGPASVLARAPSPAARLVSIARHMTSSQD
jgi:hypothetical protein